MDRRKGFSARAGLYQLRPAPRTEPSVVLDHGAWHVAQRRPEVLDWLPAVLRTPCTTTIAATAVTNTINAIGNASATSPNLADDACRSAIHSRGRYHIPETSVNKRQIMTTSVVLCGCHVLSRAIRGKRDDQESAVNVIRMATRPFELRRADRGCVP